MPERDANSSRMDYILSNDRSVAINFNGVISGDPREIILKAYNSFISSDNWTWLYRREKYSTWYLTTKTIQQADSLAALDDIQVSDSLSLTTVSCAREVLSMRLHWLPSSVEKAAICNFFGEYGKVLEVQEELCTIPGLLNVKSGVRSVRIEIAEHAKERLPHKCRIGRHMALLTFRGRPPLCLKCGETGHVRNRCPTRPVPEPSTPLTAAQRVMRGAVERQRTVIHNDSDSDLDIEGIQREDIASGIPDLYGDSQSQSVTVTSGYAVQAPPTPTSDLAVDLTCDIISPTQEESDTRRVKKQRLSEISHGPTPPPVSTSNPFDLLAEDSENTTEMDQGVPSGS